MIMKKHLLHTAFAFTLLTAGFTASYGQEVNNPGTAPFSTEEVKEAFELKTFNAIFRNSKVFVNWTVTDATGDCIYLVERSTDGTNYQKIAVKKGAPSPGKAVLMFSHIDDKPVNGKTYYRIQRAGTSGTTYSQVLAVESTPQNDENGAVLGLAKVK
jgi:hypothetical protein